MPSETFRSTVKTVSPPCRSTVVVASIRHYRTDQLIINVVALFSIKLDVVSLKVNKKRNLSTTKKSAVERRIRLYLLQVIKKNDFDT